MNPYRKVSVQTASPKQLLMMLYDGAIRFCGMAEVAIRADDASGAGEAISRAMAIVAELQATLNHDVAPELCKGLSDLYDYMIVSLTKANVQRDPAPLAEVAELIRTVRGGFAQVNPDPKGQPIPTAADGAAPGALPPGEVTLR